MGSATCGKRLGLFNRGAADAKAGRPHHNRIGSALTHEESIMSDQNLISGPLSGVLRRYRGTQPDSAKKRKPGRPRKRTTEYLCALLEDHRKVEAWYIATHGSKPESDRQLYVAFYGRQFTIEGDRASRASTPDFLRVLRNLTNELGMARRLERSQHQNPALLVASPHVK